MWGRIKSCSSREGAASLASLWATGELLVPLWWRGGRSCSSGWEAACHSTLGLPDGEEVLELRHR